jgi:hypothetical protein
MSDQEWHFRLHGDAFDLNGIADLFSDEVSIVKDERDQLELIMNLSFSPSEPQAARQIGEGVLAKLNAIAQIVHGNHENVRIGGVGHKDPLTGTVQYSISGQATIRVGARGDVNIVPTSGGPATPSQKRGDQFLDAANGNQHLERALYLLGSLPLDWRGLYMVLEAAEDGNGGEKGLIAKQWVPVGQIKAFKATANSYKALRLAARHGSVKEGVDRPRMALNEGRQMVRTILDKWSGEATPAP